MNPFFKTLALIAMTCSTAQQPTSDSKVRPGSKSDAAPQSNPVINREVRVFPLRHTTPDTVMETVVPLFKNAPMVANAATNSLIVTGTPHDLSTIEGLIEKIDRPVDPSRSATPGVRTIQLRHRSTQDVTKQLMSLIGGIRDRDARVASDEGRGKIILRGSNDFIEFGEHVVAELDVPAQMIRFEFAFFSADQNATGEPNDSGNIPADLESVARELGRFGRVRLLGRLACSSMEDRQFLVEGSLGDGLSAKVTGQVINAVSDGTIQLNVQGSIRLSRTFGGDPKVVAPPRSSAFELNTTVVTKRGETIMIGSAPAGWNPGESAIMVLQAKQ